MTRIKICGISDADTALVAAEAGANAIGLILAPSRRRVSAEQAREITSSLPPFIARVGVFVDEDQGVVREVVTRAGLDTVQLHGSETPEYCSVMPVPVVKAIRVRDTDSLSTLHRYRVAAFLLDTYDPETLGGTGRPFDWNLAADIPGAHRVILSGGLNPANVVEALERVRPFGVDVSSGVETDGRKDHSKIREFIRRVREWDLQNEKASLRGG
ncbi:MAG TPA: phosphoribosylanthranilate isomerase [bacterium]|nr:phosphoribosylanthranilate isomerase [bacterium]